jgi:hypothetical protein
MPYRSTILHPKRTVFISYYGGDDQEVKEFLAQWATGDTAVFTPRILGDGVYAREGLIDSTNSEYVMAEIRRRYIRDASVTLLLVGTCTHSRRYVDWELKATLRRGDSDPNGLLAILLASANPGRGGSFPHLPARFAKNHDSGNVNCYARYYYLPSSADELDGWIEDAVEARTSRARLIQNDADMMSRNATCLIHRTVH